MAYPQAYVEFIAHFHGTRDYFECHELLEEHWKEERDPGLLPLWHGLIQVAVSAYHERRGNLRGALKMAESALRLLASAEPARVGLDAPKLQADLQERISRMRECEMQVVSGAERFQDPELPIQDEALAAAAQKLAEEWGVDWKQPSPPDNRELIERHTRRDRSDVVEERRRSLGQRRLERGTEV